jgi:hypothetical protein
LVLVSVSMTARPLSTKQSTELSGEADRG